MRSKSLTIQATECLAIWSLAMLAAVICGVLNTQIAARVSIEYFTLGMPADFKVENLTWFAIKTGVLQTWWLGAALGTLLAIAARAGNRPRFKWQFFIRPMFGLVLMMTLVAMAAGIFGYVATRNGALELYYSVARHIEPVKRAAFMGNQCAQLAAYWAAAISGTYLCVWVWKKRAEVEAMSKS